MDDSEQYKLLKNDEVMYLSPAAAAAATELI